MSIAWSDYPNLLPKFRVIFMEDHIPIRLDRGLLFVRQTSKWTLLDVVFHKNYST